MQILIRNAEQILDIITATFGGEIFDTSLKIDPCLHKDTDVGDLACRWQHLAEMAKNMNTKSDIDQEWTLAMSQVRYILPDSALYALTNLP